MSEQRPVAAGKRHACQANSAVIAGNGGESVCSRCRNDIVDRCSAGNDRNSGGRIDSDMTHGREIDDHAASFEHAADRVGLAAANRDCEAMGAGRADRQLDILARLTPCDHRRQMIFGQMIVTAVRTKLRHGMAFVARQEGFALHDRLQMGRGDPSDFGKRRCARHVSSPIWRHRYERWELHDRFSVAKKGFRCNRRASTGLFSRSI
jgi:hypothetical protein